MPRKSIKSTKTSTRHNLGNVISFEVVRNLKKPFFWIIALLLPALLVGYVLIVALSSQNTSDTISQNSDTTSLRLGVYDGANYLLSNEFINSNNETQSAEIYADSETGIEAVKNNTLDVFYVIPDDFAQNPSVQIYAKPSSSNIFTSYQAPILTLLTNTAVATTAPENIAILTNTVAVESINFSAETDEVIDTNAIISRMIIPGVGLALFYILIIVLGNRLTTAMVEEKENRISEMILTSMRPQDLITGKIISLIILGLIQLTILILPVIILYSLGIAKDLIPFEFNIDWNPWLIISTIALLLSSYFLFTALCVTVSTLVPTAKDAGSFASIIVILVILPFFFVGDFTSNNPSALAYILSYFPPSAPLALMFRNTFGTLPAWEAILGFIVICASGFLLVKLAVYIFKRTAIEFTARVNLRALLQKPRKNWKKN